MRTATQRFCGGSTAPGEQYAECPCGSAWFSLRRPAHHPELPDGAVSITQHGEIVAYAGDLVCVNCGQLWMPPDADFD